MAGHLAALLAIKLAGLSVAHWVACWAAMRVVLLVEPTAGWWDQLRAGPRAVLLVARSAVMWAVHWVVLMAEQ